MSIGVVKWSAPGAAVGLAALFWAIWFGRLALMSWDGFWFGVFDVGIFDQGTWLLSQGEEPFVTLRGLHLFADHTSYILALVAPLYRVWSDINVLVLLAVVIPASAVYVTYRIGLAEGLRPWTSVAVALVFLLHPALAWTTWDSFHPETFAILLIPAAYLAAKRDRGLVFVLFCALLLLVKEDAVFVVIPLALYAGLKWKRFQTMAAGLIVLAAGVAVLNFRVILPGYSPTGELIYSGRYSLQVQPLVTASRFGYLVSMLLPSVIATRAPLALAIAGPITVANLASTHAYQHEIKWHYTAYLLGVLAVAVPVGMAKLADKWGPDVGLGLISASGRRSIPILGPLLALAVAGLVVVGPSLTFQGDWGAASAQEQEEVHSAFDLIPPNAVVAASYTFAPHLAHREQIYMLPNPWIRDYWGTPEGLPALPDPTTVEWMAVDLDVGGATTRVVEDLVAIGWSEVVSGERILLLRSP